MSVPSPAPDVGPLPDAHPEPPGLSHLDVALAAAQAGGLLGPAWIGVMCLTDWFRWDLWLRDAVPWIPDEDVASYGVLPALYGTLLLLLLIGRTRRAPLRNFSPEQEGCLSLALAGTAFWLLFFFALYKIGQALD